MSASEFMERFPTPWTVYVDAVGVTFLSAGNDDWICDVGAMRNDGTNASQEVAEFIVQAVNSQAVVVTVLQEIIAATVEPDDEPSRMLVDIGRCAEAAFVKLGGDT